MAEFVLCYAGTPPEWHVKPEDMPRKRRWRHVKRGSIYTEIGRGKMQAAGWSRVWRVGDQTDGESVDMADVVIYQSEADGSVWVRPVAEFEDGRFVELEPWE